MAICSLAACLRIEDLFRPICSAIWALLKPCRASFLSCSSSSDPNRSGCLTASLIPILGALFRMADSLLFNSLAMARTRLPAADNSRRIVSSRTVHGRSPAGLSVISSSSARTRPGGGCVSWSVYFSHFPPGDARLHISTLPAYSRMEAGPGEITVSDLNQTSAAAMAPRVSGASNS
jgi:hypothetical protein